MSKKLSEYLEETDIEHSSEIEFVRIGMKLNESIFQSASQTEKFFFAKTLTKEEIRSIITFARRGVDYIMADILQLSYDTGCRVMELANITVSNIDIDSRNIQVQGKGGYIRNVNWCVSSDSIIGKFMQNNHGPLLPYKKTTIKAYSKRIFRKWAQDRAKEIKKPRKEEEVHRLSKISIHWFRHSRATHLAVIWKDVIRLKAYMGWNDVSMANIYVNTSSQITAMQKYKSIDLWED